MSLPAQRQHTTSAPLQPRPTCSGASSIGEVIPWLGAALLLTALDGMRLGNRPRRDWRDTLRQATSLAPATEKTDQPVTYTPQSSSVGVSASSLGDARDGGAVGAEGAVGFIESVPRNSTGADDLERSGAGGEEVQNVAVHYSEELRGLFAELNARDTPKWWTMKVRRCQVPIGTLRHKSASWAHVAHDERVHSLHQPVPVLASD